MITLRAFSIFLVFLSGCQVRCGGGPGGPQTGNPVSPMSATGPETWMIDGKPTPIASTYYLALPEGMQFTIETPVEKVPLIESDALEEAWPLMKYAFEKGLHTRTTVHAVGTGDVAASRVGVAFFKKEGAKTTGIRVALGIGAIEYRLKNGGRGPSE